MAYSYSQLEGLWIKAGGDPAVAPIAAAIVFPESGGNPQALNPTDNGGSQSSFGLWQISTGTHNPPDPNWADPLTNARLAVEKYKGAGNSFSPWGTYVTGAYRQYLQGGVAPDMNAGGAGNIGTPVGQDLNSPSLTNPGTWLTPLVETVYNVGNYVFMGTVVMMGFGLLAFGLVLLVREGVKVEKAAGVVVNIPKVVVSGPKGKARAVRGAVKAKTASKATRGSKEVNERRQSIPAQRATPVKGELG